MRDLLIIRVLINSRMLIRVFCCLSKDKLETTIKYYDSQNIKC